MVTVGLGKMEFFYRELSEMERKLCSENLVYTIRIFI